MTYPEACPHLLSVTYVPALAFLVNEGEEMRNQIMSFHAQNMFDNILVRVTALIPLNFHIEKTVSFRRVECSL